jgi:hypothetical protein
MTQSVNDTVVSRLTPPSQLFKLHNKPYPTMGELFCLESVRSKHKLMGLHKQKNLLSGFIDTAGSTSNLNILANSKLDAKGCDTVAQGKMLD